MNVRHNIAAAQGAHGVAQQIAADALHDVLHELGAVGLDAFPLFRHAHAHIGHSRRAELVLADPGLGVTQVSAGGQVNEQHSGLHMEADTVGIGGGLIPHRRHNRFVHVPPQPGDVRIGSAPLPDQRRKFLFGQTHFQCAHGLECAHRAAVTESQFGDLALLTKMAVNAMLFHRHTEHLAGGGAVNIAAALEHLHAPLLTGQPCDHAGFYRAEVADDELSTCAGDKGGANQFRQHVWHRTVPLLNSFVIAVPHTFSGFSKLLHVVLGQVLQLHIASGPAPGAVGSIELDRAAHTPVRTGSVAHSDILFHAGLGQLLPQNEHFFQIRWAIFEQRCHLFFAETFGEHIVLGQPLFHLLHGIGVFKAGQLLHLLRQLGAGAHIHLNGAFHQLPVDDDTPVVDLLILMILFPYVLLHGIPAQALLNAHLRFHVPQVICFEQRPLFRRVLRQVAGATAVCFGGSTGLAEIADQLLAFAQLLLIQRQRRAHAHQRQRQAEVCRPDHGAVPLCRIKELVVRQSQIPGQAHALKVGVKRPLGNTLIRKRREDFLRDMLTAGQIDHLHGVVVHRIAKQQNFKIRRFAVAIDRGFIQVNAGIGFYIKADVVQ